MEVRMKSRVPMQSILTNHLMIVRSANTPFLSLLNLNPIEFHCTLTLVPYEPIIYQDKVVCKRTYSHHLRGPPVA